MLGTAYKEKVREDGHVALTPQPEPYPAIPDHLLSAKNAPYVSLACPLMLPLSPRACSSRQLTHINSAALHFMPAAPLLPLACHSDQHSPPSTAKATIHLTASSTRRRRQIRDRSAATRHQQEDPHKPPTSLPADSARPSNVCINLLLLLG